MAIKFEKLQEGMTIWDVRPNKRSGFCGGKWSTWPVKIISVNNEERTVIASWNCNSPQVMSESRVCRFRAKKPIN